MQNHYLALGVHKSSTLEEIKVAFRRAAIANHPDRHNNDPDKAASMAIANIAYSVLSNSKLRKKYDVELANFCNKCLTCDGKGVTVKQRGFQSKVRTACVACSGAGWLDNNGENNV